MSLIVELLVDVLGGDDTSVGGVDVAVAAVRQDGQDHHVGAGMLARGRTKIC